MRLSDIRFVPRPVSRARRQGTRDELAVLRAEASANTPRERTATHSFEVDLSAGLKELRQQRLRLEEAEKTSPPEWSSDLSENALQALRREGAKRPEFVVAIATAFLRPATTERLLSS